MMPAWVAGSLGLILGFLIRCELDFVFEYRANRPLPPPTFDDVRVICGPGCDVPDLSRG